MKKTKKEKEKLKAKRKGSLGSEQQPFKKVLLQNGVGERVVRGELTTAFFDCCLFLTQKVNSDTTKKGSRFWGNLGSFGLCTKDQLPTEEEVPQNDVGITRNGRNIFHYRPIHHCGTTYAVG